MIINHKQNSHHRLIAAMRQRLYILLIAGFYILNACSPAAQLQAQPKAVTGIVHIQPFRLEKPYKFDWHKDRPEVRSGLLVVLRVDTSLIMPTNDLEPVLYAGNTTVQRLNQGYQSGFLIAIIPAQLDLSKEPVWFGTPALPERIDGKTITSERTRAIRAGIKPFPADEVKNKTKETVTTPDLTALLRKYAGDLILEFSPYEKYLVEAWRLPETRK